MLRGVPGGKSEEETGKKGLEVVPGMGGRGSKYGARKWWVESGW